MEGKEATLELIDTYDCKQFLYTSVDSGWLDLCTQGGPLLVVAAIV